MVTIRPGAKADGILAGPPDHTSVHIYAVDVWEIPLDQVCEVLDVDELDPGINYAIRMERSATRDDLLLLSIMQGFKIVPKENP